ncbi:Pr6Pr family membrane protein [Flavobacterium notoginsengisoli]|uniref:Pr6Pr family membrane protein n=1 Tax=Flavobacterium notoginsengisoli TaxID=1478199 RepID=UPI00364562BA
MEKQNTTKIGNEVLLGIILALELYALPTQFYLLINQSEFTLFSAIVRFFSFFTILTNSIVFICSALILFGGRFEISTFFRKTTTITAITVYIIIVGLVFNLLLRSVVDLKGLHRVVSEIFHTVVPILFFLYWLFYINLEKISFKTIIVWLVYPIIYVIYTLLHGIYTDFYPYPFIDAVKLGFPTAITNGLFVLLAFAILAYILVFISKLKNILVR